MKALLFATGLLFTNTFLGYTETISWSGAADGSSWNKAGNWLGGLLPGPNSDVVIASGAGATVIISSGTVSVRSMQCAKGLSVSGGTLVLTAGASQVSGDFAISGGGGLTVQGSGSSFVANGLTTVVDADLTVLSGGALRLPNLRSATNNTSSTLWKADGIGSVLDLSAVANLGISFYQRLDMRVYSGANVDLHRVTVTTGAVRAYAEDPGSVVDLSGLSGRWASKANSPLSLEAKGGGSILIPNVTQLENASLRLDDTGTMPTAQLDLLTNVDLTVDGSAPNFGRVTNIDDTTVTALNGGLARLTNVTAVVGVGDATWKADGPGSRVDVSTLKNLTVGYYRRLYLQAYNGGTVDAHRLNAATSSIYVDAQDADSVVDLSGLAGRWSSKANSGLRLEARGGASILIPNVTQIENGALRIDDTGIVPTAQLNLLTNVDLTVDGSAPNFGHVTNIDDTTVTALNGGVARLTNVVEVVNGTVDATWKADGTGSLVDLSMLKNLAVGYYHRLYLQAYNGGTVDVHRLNGTTSSIFVDAQDPDSVVDLSGLAGRWSSQGNSGLRLEARGGASILIPNVTQIENGALRIDDTGIVPTAQLNLLTNVDLTVDGSAPNFGRITNIDDTTVTALNGGVARLTNVVKVVNGAADAIWKADGTGSLVDLSMLKNLAVGYYHRLYLQAYNGGTVDVPRLNGTTSSIFVDAQDPDSVVDLSGLAGRWSSQANSGLRLESRGGASVLIPNVTEMENGALRIDDTGIIPTAQLNLLTNVDLTVDGSAPNFGRITNIDDTTVTALNGGVARLTNVVKVVNGAADATWKADGTGSLVDLSMLKNLAVGYYHRLYLQAYNGGTVDVHRLNGTTSSIFVDAQDPDSVVDLSGLAGRWSSQANSGLRLESRGGASVLIPNVTQIENGALRIDDTGSITTAQLNLLTNVDLTVDGSAPNFGGVTNIDDTSITALNGGQAHLTNVSRAVVGAQEVTWKADDSGSLVDLSNLTRVAVSFYQRLYVQAYNGGKVDLSHLQSLSTGSVQILADGSNSAVDLTGLSSFISVGNSASSLTARNSGRVDLGTQAFLLANVAISIPSGNPVLPPTVVASATLSLYGAPWHSYWIDRRDTRDPDSPWLFTARMPLVTAIQPIAPAPPPNTEFRVWDFQADPPMLDLFPATGHQAQLVLYGVPGQTYQILSGADISPGGAWQPGTTVTMTNAFRVFAPVPTANPILFFRAKKL